MKAWLSALYVALVLAMGLVSLWPRLTVQFAPTEVRAQPQPSKSQATLPSPLTTPTETTAKPRPEESRAGNSTPAAVPVTLMPAPDKLPSYTLKPSKNSLATLAPGPVRPATAKVNLNTASQAELESLPRVGPALSKRIIEGRPYHSLQDLDRVKGVGPKMLELLRPLVSF